MNKIISLKISFVKSSMVKKLISNSSFPKNTPKFITFISLGDCSAMALKEASTDVCLFL